jgi:hypothetical protein
MHAAQCVTYIIPFFVHLVEEDSMIYLAKCRSCFQRDCLVVTHAAQCVTYIIPFFIHLVKDNSMIYLAKVTLPT